MKCPFCQHPENKVVDSRDTRDGDQVRRRRECLGCTRRFTTYERVDVVMPMVVKKDGRREAWNRDKVSSGLLKASEKRPVPVDALEEAVARVERTVQDAGTREVSSEAVGEAVMNCLKDLDDVAYVRFASVYRSFRDIDEFMAALESLVKERGGLGRS
ncbi:MAG: transcriptional regulator NrdR [Deltaproteobacteria bacterium]